ncbi:flippase-like domain-containing protein [Candidatus Woesearchaeota archaeon]|nr:flippase-like domain-containing protein [Candidatus Woesearchaeota archaeon]
MKKNSVSIIVSTLIGVLVLLFLYTKINIKEVLAIFKNITWQVLAVYLAAIILIEIFLVVRWDVILKEQNRFVPFANLLMYKEAGYAVGYITPQAHLGGEPVRALLLKRHHMSFKTALSSILIDKSLILVTDTFFGSIGVLLLLINLEFDPLLRILCILIGLIPLLLIFCFYYRLLRGLPFFTSLFRSLRLNKIKFTSKFEKDLRVIEKDMIDFFKNHKRVFIKIVLIQLILWSLMYVEYKSALLMLGYNTPLHRLFLILSSVAISYVMPVPLALGVLEFGQVSTLSLLKLPSQVGLAISLLIRIKDILRTAIGLIVLSYFGLPWNWKSKH